MILPLFLALGLGQMTCRAVPGAEALIADRGLHYVFIGETHGSREEPEIVADLACQLAASGRPIVVALEKDPDTQLAIDTYLRSDGSPAARGGFLASLLWSRGAKYGQASRAYFDMFEHLRELSRVYPTLEVLAFDGLPAIVGPSESANVWSNRGMAERLQAERQIHPEALILVYVGSVHARAKSADIGGEVFQTAASLLPAEERLSLRFSAEGGEAWNCQAAGCGVVSREVV